MNNTRKNTNRSLKKAAKRLHNRNVKRAKRDELNTISKALILHSMKRSENNGNSKRMKNAVKTLKRMKHLKNMNNSINQLL